jgi:hypothetical protein
MISHLRIGYELALAVTPCEIVTFSVRGAQPERCGGRALVQVTHDAVLRP